MFTTEQTNAIVAIFLAFVVVVTLAVAFVAWAIARRYPSRTIAPLVPAVLAAVLLSPRGESAPPLFVVPPLLAGVAVALVAALRAPATDDAHAPGERGSSPGTSALAFLFVVWAVAWGLILAARGRLAAGAVLLCAAPLAARAIRPAPTASPARGRWQIVAGWIAAGLAAAVYAMAFARDVPDLEGFPPVADELRRQAFFGFVTSAPMLVASALLLAVSGLRPRTLLRVDAAILALCFGALAGIELWTRYRATARLDRITEAEVVFVPPPGWSELPGPGLRPMRAYERRDGRESVLVLPLLPRRRTLAVYDWCNARGAAAAAQMAEQLDGSTLVTLERERGGGCRFEGTLAGPAQGGTAHFGYFLCNDQRDAAVAYLHVWRDGWTFAPAGVAAFGPSTLHRSISRNLRCK